MRAVVENLPDSRGEPAGTMRPKMKELLGRVSSRHSSDAHIWQLYAGLYGDGRTSNPEDDEKVRFLSCFGLFFKKKKKVVKQPVFPLQRANEVFVIETQQLNQFGISRRAGPVWL